MPNMVDLMNQAARQPRGRSGEISAALSIGFSANGILRNLDWFEVPLTEEEKSTLRELLERIDKWSLDRAGQGLHEGSCF